MTKRERFATLLSKTSILDALERLPKRPQLLVLNYHRIGNACETQYDKETFEATREGLDSHIEILKRSYRIVNADEALDIIAGRRRPNGAAILLTFDDGYRDNFKVALPVLKSHNVSALFFLVTEFLSSPTTPPWWDQIAWIVRNSVGYKIRLHEPDFFEVTVSKQNVDWVIIEVLRRCRDNANSPAEILQTMQKLQDAAAIPVSNSGERILMNWEEARVLVDAGMAIGAHTHTHPILSRLSVDDQRAELRKCKELLAANLGSTPKTLAYPVGSLKAFSQETKRVAREEGFVAAFSYYGKTNTPGAIDPFDVHRVSFHGDEHRARRRAAIALMTLTKRFWL